MLAELDSKEYAEWRAFFELEPWGGARNDLRAGLLASLLHSAWFKGAAKGPSDWFPNLADDRPQQTPQQAAARGKAWAEYTQANG